MTGLNVGNCPLHGTTTAGYTCGGDWVSGGMPVATPKQAKAPKKLSDKWANLDLVEAAQKVLSFNEPVNIMMVQRRLRCPYTIAAKVVEVIEKER